MNIRDMQRSVFAKERVSDATEGRRLSAELLRDRQLLYTKSVEDEEEEAVQRQRIIAYNLK